MRKFRKGWRIFIIPLIAVVFIAVGYVTMCLWNALMPVIFHLPLITFWQAIGLIILARLILGFGGHHRAWAHHQRGHFMREKWEKMTPEEREQLKNRWGSCWTRKEEKSE